MGLAYYLYGLKNNIEHRNFNYDFGLEIQRNIYYSNNFRMYILAGGYYYLDDDRKQGNGNKLNIINHSYNVGVGISGEYYYKRFVLSLYLGYKFYEDRLETTENENQYPAINRVTKIGAGAGLGFMF